MGLRMCGDVCGIVCVLWLLSVTVDVLNFLFCFVGVVPMIILNPFGACTVGGSCFVGVSCDLPVLPLMCVVLCGCGSH